MPIKSYLGKTFWGVSIQRVLKPLPQHLFQTEYELRKQKPAKHVMCQIYYTTAISLDMNKLGLESNYHDFFHPKMLHAVL